MLVEEMITGNKKGSNNLNRAANNVNLRKNPNRHWRGSETLTRTKVKVVSNTGSWYGANHVPKNRSCYEKLSDGSYASKGLISMRRTASEVRREAAKKDAFRKKHR